MTTRTLFPFSVFVTLTMVPSGSDLCAAVRFQGRKISPLAVGLPEYERPYHDATPFWWIVRQEIDIKAINIISRRSIVSGCKRVGWLSKHPEGACIFLFYLFSQVQSRYFISPQRWSLLERSMGLLLDLFDGLGKGAGVFAAPKAIINIFPFFKVVPMTRCAVLSIEGLRPHRPPP